MNGIYEFENINAETLGVTAEDTEFYGGLQTVLASKSPRRRELLGKAGLRFSVLPAVNEEKITETDPEKTVMELAAQKADEVYEKLMTDPDFFEKDPRPLLVIGADTVVFIDGKILGKPKDTEDAARMLRLLSGRTHKVATGFSLIYRKPGQVLRRKIGCETALVSFFSLSDSVIMKYIETGEPMDKAGSYGIQGLGGDFVREIRGDFANVMGLPVKRVLREIRTLAEEKYC